MVGALSRAGLALATTASAAAAASPVRVSGSSLTSAFGGTTPVRLTHVGHIETALGPAGAGALRHVQCAGAATGTSCYVAR